LLEFSNGVAETAVPMRGACPARIAQYGRLALPACACNRVIYAAWAICGRPGM